MAIGLFEARNLLVRRWGDMGGYWGINRTMAELHALLFVTRKPLCTDDIMEQLQISRGNASMNLRALVDWGLIERVHRFGDRKEYFQADADVWHMFETIMRERRRREVEPIVATLERRGGVAAAATAAAPPTIGQGKDAVAGQELDEDIREFRSRVQRLQNFLCTMGKLFDLMLQVGPTGVEQFATLARMDRASVSKPAKTPVRVAKPRITRHRTTAKR
jgi:hypothetical protein